jgi:hypothetical protein
LKEQQSSVILQNNHDANNQKTSKKAKHKMVKPNNISFRTAVQTKEQNFDCSRVVNNKNLSSRFPRKAKEKTWQDYIVDEEGNFGFKLSVKGELQGEYSQQTREAIVNEIKNFLDYQVGHYTHYNSIPLTHRNLNILSTFMFIKHKNKLDGRYDKKKARLVVDGSRQGKHLYDFISSTTVTLSLVFVLFNIASYFKCFMVTYDIKGAFLNAIFQEDDEPTYVVIRKEIADIWERLDPSCAEYRNLKGDLILTLDKFVYGLKQAPVKFQMHLRNALD